MLCRPLLGDLLGRHVRRSSEHLARLRQHGDLLFGDVRQTEVQHDTAAFGCDDHVARFHVAVHDALLVGRVQGPRNVLHQTQGAVQTIATVRPALDAVRKRARRGRDGAIERHGRIDIDHGDLATALTDRAALSDQLRQRHSRHVAHGDEGNVSLERRLVDRADAGMIQPCGRHRLAPEALDQGRRLGPDGRHDLQRHVAPHAFVASQPDDALPPAAEFFHQPIRTDAHAVRLGGLRRLSGSFEIEPGSSDQLLLTRIALQIVGQTADLLRFRVGSHLVDQLEVEPVLSGIGNHRGLEGEIMRTGIRTRHPSIVSRS